MDGYQDILVLFLGGIVLLFLVFFLAESLSIILRNADLRPYSAFFAVLCIASSVAIVFTKFNTCFSGFFIVLFFVFIDLKKLLTITHKLSKLKIKIFHKIFISSIYYSIIFAILIFIYFPLSGEAVKVYPDIYSYINQINLMEKYGLETFLSELENKAFNQELSIRPYHYFEFWICIAAKKLTGQNSFSVFTLFLPSFLSALFFTFIYFEFKVDKTRLLTRFVLFLIPIAIVTTTRFVVFDDEPVAWLTGHLPGMFEFCRAVLFQNFGSWHFFSFMHGVKFLISCLFVFPVFYLIFKKRFDLIPYLLVLLPFISGTYLPFFLVANFFLLVISVTFKKNYLALPIQLLSFSLFIGFYLFQYFSLKNIGSGSGSILGFNVHFAGFGFLISYIKEFIFDFFNNYFYLLLLFSIISLFFNFKKYFLFFLILLSYFFVLVNHNLLFKAFILILFLAVFINSKSQFKNISIWIAFGILISLMVISSLIPSVVDAFQFSSLVSIPFYYFLPIIALVFMASSLSRTKEFVLLFLLMGWLVNNAFAIFIDNRRSCQLFTVNDFYKSLNKKIEAGQSKAVFYNNYSVFPYIHFDKVGMELLNFSDQLISTGMNISHFSPADSLVMKNSNVSGLLNELPFSRFCLKNSHLKGQDLDSAFVAANKVDLVFVDGKYDFSRVQYLRNFKLDSLENDQFKYKVYILDHKNKSPTFK